MGRSGQAVALVAAMLAGTGARAGEPAAEDAPRLELGAGYCQYLLGSSAAQSARLMGPELFGTVGVLNVGDPDTGVITSPRPRLQVGLSYSFGDLLQGIMLRRKAHAECRRYQAEQVLEAALAHGDQIGAAAALEARARVLEELLPQANAMVTELRVDVREARATAEELNVTQLRLDALRSTATQTRIELERARARPEVPPQRTLPQLSAEFRAADDRLEAVSGTLRSAQSWDLTVRGGYDDVIGVTEQVPLFGVVTLSYNLGNLFQGAANSRAREGRRLSLRQDVRSADRKLEALARELQATYEAESARLAELQTLLGDLETQYEQVKALRTSLVRRYQGYLWFEIARMKAEHAYLSVHVEALRTFLGIEP